MKFPIAKIIFPVLLLTTGLAETSISYASKCDKPEYRVFEDQKIKNSNLLSRLNELGLTPTQQTQIKTMKIDLDAQMQQLHTPVKNADKEAIQMIQSSTLDEAGLNSHVETLNRVFIPAQTQMAIFRHKIYDMLNQAQQTKYTALQHQEQLFYQMNLECPEMAMKAINKTDFDPLDNLQKLKLSQ